MSPMQYDPNTTAPIDRDELSALVRRLRDTGAHPSDEDASDGRAPDVVVHRAAVSAWLEARK